MTHEEYRAAMKQFLVGLEKLTRETGIAIGATGDMGSPWMCALSPYEITPEYGYTSRSDGDDVAWRKDAGSDHEGLNSKTEQESEDNNDDI